MFTAVLQDSDGLMVQQVLSDERLQAAIWEPGKAIVAIMNNDICVRVETLARRSAYQVLLRRGGAVDVENATGWSGLRGDLIDFYRDTEVIATFEREAVAGVIALPADG